jgi:rare lipoprotein A
MSRNFLFIFFFTLLFAPKKTSDIQECKNTKIKRKPVKREYSQRNRFGIFDVCTQSHFIYNKCGEASWYQDGEFTCIGEPFDPDGFTAAVLTLPLPCVIEVSTTDCDKKNRKIVTVKGNDRGPFTNHKFNKKRIIDLSRGAAQELEMIGAGHIKVRVHVLEDETHLLSEWGGPIKWNGKRKWHVELQRFANSCRYQDFPDETVKLLKKVFAKYGITPIRK